MKINNAYGVVCGHWQEFYMLWSQIKKNAKQILD